MLDLTIIEFTSDVIVNHYISIFIYITAVIVPLFGALSLLSR